MEKIGLVICTTGLRESQLARARETYIRSAEQCGVNLELRIYRDPDPSPGNLAHLVGIRNQALDCCQERWAFFCDDDDFVFDNHVRILTAAMVNHPLATVVMSQAQDAKGKRLGFTLACSLVNVDRFRMTGWMCPPEGGEDFFTLSTLQVRGHQVVKEPTITWQVCDEVPSLTRKKRVELHKKSRR